MSDDYDDYEEDDMQDTYDMEAMITPVYRLEVLDLVGVTLRTFGNIFGAISGGFHMMANDLVAGGAYRRQEAEKRDFKEWADRGLERLLHHGDDS